jgi:hypothetical protein
LKNKPGSTAFHLAVQNTGRGGSQCASGSQAQREIIKEFLSFGVGWNLRNSSGKLSQILFNAHGFEKWTLDPRASQAAREPGS